MWLIEFLSRIWMIFSNHFCPNFKQVTFMIKLLQSFKFAQTIGKINQVKRVIIHDMHSSFESGPHKMTKLFGNDSPQNSALKALTFKGRLHSIKRGMLKEHF